MDDKPNDNPLVSMTPAQWQLECERVLINAGLLLRLARRTYAASAIVELIRNMPRSQEEMERAHESMTKAMTDELKFSTYPSLFGRCMIDAYRLSQYDRELFASVVSYWNEFARMPSDRRAMLEASAVGSVYGVGMG